MRLFFSSFNWNFKWTGLWSKGRKNGGREREKMPLNPMRALFIKAVIDNEIQHAVIERKPISFLSLVSIYCHTYVKRTNASGTFWLWNARITCEHCNFGICIQIEVYSFLLDLLGIKEKGRERKRKSERRATKLSFAALCSSKWFSTNLRTDVQTCSTWQHISNVLANVISSIRLHLRRRLRTIVVDNSKSRTLYRIGGRISFKHIYSGMNAKPCIKLDALKLPLFALHIIICEFSMNYISSTIDRSLMHLMYFLRANCVIMLPFIWSGSFDQKCTLLSFLQTIVVGNSTLFWLFFHSFD